MEKKQRWFFLEEFKRQAVERAETSGLLVMDVAAELGIHEIQLGCWIRQFGRSGMGPARRTVTQVLGPSPADLAAGAVARAGGWPPYTFSLASTVPSCPDAVYYSPCSSSRSRRSRHRPGRPSRSSAPTPCPSLDELTI